jgi:anti-sigma B factor antagonist
MSVDDEGFVIRSSDSEPGTIQVGGELDAHAANKLDDVVDELLANGVTSLVMDMGELTFIDSSGLRSLIRARKRLGDQPRAVVLRDPQAGTVRLLEITGLTDQFPVV